MASSSAQAGVPIQLLHEAENNVVTIELKSGEAYRGLLLEAEETMNCQLKEGNIVYHIVEMNHIH
jgi:small nuclear ribonucleoprotein D3